MDAVGMLKINTRRVGSKEEIWAEADRLLRRRLAGMSTRIIDLPLPSRIDEADATGCNWRMEIQMQDQTPQALVNEVVEEIRATWNIK